MAVRLLFEVSFKGEQKHWGGGDPKQKLGSVKLSPRLPNDADPAYAEVKSFYEATPGGQIEFATINERALAEFQVGDLFYVTLEKRQD